MFHVTYDWTIEKLREHLYEWVKTKEIVDYILPFQDKDMSIFHTNLSMKTDKRLKTQGTTSIWTIHGNYTKSGFPILVANPNLDLGVPSMLHVSEMKYDNHFTYGFAFPGTPLYIFGRNSNLTWGPTSVEYDIS